MDYYKTLNISRNATIEDIKKAYRKLALKYHPDRNKDKDAEEQFKKVSEAYSVLSDPQKKQQYDRFGTVSSSVGQSYSSNFGGFGDFDDLFNSFFGHSHKKQVKKGTDIQQSVEITLEESYFGTKKTINYHQHIECVDCQGSGGETKICSNCSGYGQIRHERGFMSTLTSCSRCHGKGKQVIKKCKTCSGKGLVNKKKTIEITISPGTGDREVLRFKGMGHCENSNWISGDLLCVILLKPHSIFKKEGRNLVCTVELDIVQACLGDTIVVKFINNKDLEIKVPKGVQFNQVLKIVGKGMPMGNRYGDLFIVCKILIPKDLDDRSIGILKEFKNVALCESM